MMQKKLPKVQQQINSQIVQIARSEDEGMMTEEGVGRKEVGGGRRKE